MAVRRTGRVLVMAVKRCVVRAWRRIQESKETAGDSIKQATHCSLAWEDAGRGLEKNQEGMGGYK